MLMACLGRQRFATTSLPGSKVQRIFDFSQKKSHKFFLRDKIDLLVFDQVFVDRQYETSFFAHHDGLMSAYKKIVEPEGTDSSIGLPLILDFGSNNGMSAEFFRLYWPKSKVIGIEPDLQNFNLSIRNSPGSSFIHGAVSNSDELISISNAGSDHWGFRVQSDESGGIQGYCVPTLLKKFPSTVPFIAKFDVEGFESKIFEGNTDWIDLFHLIVIELHDWMIPGESNSTSFLKAIAGRDRDFVIRGENVFSFRN
jgi:FkbM family methyltransferase